MLLKENEEELPWTPRVITGGKGPPDPPGQTPDDWLTGTPVKTTVLIQAKKDQTPFLGQMTVLAKGQKGVLIYIPGTTQKPEWVDPVRWCRDWRSYEVIRTAEEAELEEEYNASRTDTDREVANPETSE